MKISSPKFSSLFIAGPPWRVFSGQNGLFLNPRNPRWLWPKIRGTAIATPTHSKPFYEKEFEHRRTGLNPQSCSDFIAAPSRARAALASLLAIVHCAGSGGRL